MKNKNEVPTKAAFELKISGGGKKGACESRLSLYGRYLRAKSCVLTTNANCLGYLATTLFGSDL